MKVPETRQYNQQFACPNCKTWFAQESLFSQWIRNHPDLPSSQEGLVVSDQDLIIHKYKTFRGKDFQLIMMIEIKTYRTKLKPSQRETLFIVDQFLRNRRVTPTWKPRQQIDGMISKVRSFLLNREITCRAFGMHLLTFSGGGPQDSKEIRWDKETINESQLLSLLKFEIDPDTLRPLDLRSHHKKNHEPELFSFPS